MSNRDRTEAPRRSRRRQKVRPIRIVPLHAGATDAIRSGDAAATQPANFTYRGGLLLTAVEIVTAFWGSAWGSAPQSAIAQTLNGFFGFIVSSSLVTQLAEYDVPGKRIGLGRFAGSAVITNSEPARTTTDAAIQRMIAAQVATRSLPPNSANTLYVVLLPSGVAVKSGSDQSCKVFCGYHDATKAGLYYAVVPYPDCAECLGGLSAIDALTSVCSHELAEAITDPVPGQGWYDDANGEIGDLCAWQNKKLGSYEVQRLWSNRARACV